LGVLGPKALSQLSSLPPRFLPDETSPAMPILIRMGKRLLRFSITGGEIMRRTMQASMRKSHRPAKLMLNCETIKVLKTADLTHAVGANGGVGPAQTRPCPISAGCP